jgi:hypothetical protein
MLAFVHFRETQPGQPRPLRFQVFPPEKTNFDPALALSPDGHALALVARGENGRSQVWIRDLNSLQSRPLAGTEGAGFLFWSPDSRSLAFTDGSKLKKIHVAGSAVQVICELPGKRIGQGVWNKDGIILFGIIATGGVSEGVRRISATGGMPLVITQPDPAIPGEFHDFPFFLSDARRFLYLRISSVDSQGIYSGSIDLAPDQQPSKVLVSQSSGFVYIPSRQTSVNPNIGKLLFRKSPSAQLVAQSFDEKQLTVVGEPITLAEEVGGLAAYGFLQRPQMVCWRIGAAGKRRRSSRGSIVRERTSEQ